MGRLTKYAQVWLNMTDHRLGTICTTQTGPLYEFLLQVVIARVRKQTHPNRKSVK